MKYPEIPEQLAHSPCHQGRRTDPDLHCRRGLVLGGGQACRQPESRHSNHHSGGGQTLARCQKRQLVQPHCSGMPRRKLQQRMVRAGKRCRIRKIGKR